MLTRLTFLPTVVTHLFDLETLADYFFLSKTYLSCEK